MDDLQGPLIDHPELEENCPRCGLCFAPRCGLCSDYHRLDGNARCPDCGLFFAVTAVPGVSRQAP